VEITEEKRHILYITKDSLVAQRYVAFILRLASGYQIKISVTLKYTVFRGVLFEDSY
jgi:hypothetical protein